MDFKLPKLNIEGLKLFHSPPFSDERGYFRELFRKSEIIQAGFLKEFVQDNFSLSQKNVLRGLHFQKKPKTQAKIIRVIEGRVWDVVVDLRFKSPTFGKWQGVELSEQNGLGLLVPEEFAHGFLVLSDQAKVVYKNTHEYAPLFESGIIWNDPILNINWPVKNPIVSSKDLLLPKFNSIDYF